MQKKCFYAGLVWLCLQSCVNQADPIKEGEYSKESPTAKSAPNPEAMTIALANLPICYVLCDFSQSQAAVSKADITQNALEIYQQINSTYALAYININSSQYEKPFFEYVPPANQDIETPKERKQKEAMAKEAKQRLAAALNQLSINDKANSTCIIRALGRVANDLANNPDNRKRPMRIILLSDMLEACSSDFGYINLEKPPYNKALLMLKKMKKPNYTFEGYTDINVAITASSTKPLIDSDGLQGFWKEVLAKFGYTLKSPITASLPNWIHAANNQ